MKITYDTQNDLLYIRFDINAQRVNNVIVNEHIILDISADNKLVGMEILDASEAIALEQLFPIKKQQISINDPSFMKLAV